MAVRMKPGEQLKSDRMFRWVTASCAGGRIAPDRRVFRRLDAELPALARAVRLAVPRHERLGPGHRAVRRAQQPLRHAGLDGDRDGDRRAAEPGDRPVPGRARPADAPPRHRNGHRAAGGGAEHHLRNVGPLRLRAVHGQVRRAGPGQEPGIPAPVPRAADGHWHAHRRDHPGADGSALHQRGDARRFPDGAAGREGVRLRHGRDDLGSHAQDHHALRRPRAGRRLLPRAGPRGRRDDGGDLRHRQQPRHLRLALRRRQQHRLDAGQRVHRGERGRSTSVRSSSSA